MKKAKNRVLIEYIENVVQTTPLYTDSIYRWMNREAAHIFNMKEVEGQFLKEKKIFLKKDKQPKMTLEDAQEELNFIIDNPEENRPFRDLYVPKEQYKSMVLKACANEKERTDADKAFETRLAWLKQILCLNEVEFKILRLYAYTQRSRIVNRFLNDLFSSENHYRGCTFVVSDYPEVIAETEEVVCKALSRASKLIRSGVLTMEHHECGLSKFIYGVLKTPVKDKEAMKQLLIGEKLKGKISLSGFSYLGEVPNRLKTLLKNAIKNNEEGVNILFHGSPGTGKTEFAKTIAASLKKTLYGICDGSDRATEPSREERLTDLKISDFILAKNKGILLLDEAEDLFSHNFFGEGGTSKIFMNSFLEKNKHPIIWTTNDIKCMDQAYLRRFSMLVEFKEPDSKVRQSIWNKNLNAQNVKLSSEEISELAENYTVPPAIITSVVRNTKLVEGGLNEIKDNLKMYEKALRTTFQKEKVSQKEEEFNPVLLNTEIDLEKLADRLGKLSNTNFSLCLYGAPGTGKSAYARYIAKKLNLFVVEKKVSDLISKFVGESEQNIAAAFKEAHEKKALLIFDEADSFLQDRQNSSRSWETTQVNEMLTQMEHAKSPFICTTNLMDRLDQASLRRFTFKVKYNFLKTEQVIDAFKFFFNKEVTEDDIMHLTRLSPGDFVVVKKKAIILDCLEKVDELIQMLASEMAVKKTETIGCERRMGFVQ